MKKIIFIGLFVLLFFSIKAQNNLQYPYPIKYHFIYVDLYGSDSKVDIKNKIEELLNNIQKSNDSFFLFISNGENFMFVNNYKSINKDLYNNIISIYTGLPNYDYDLNQIIEKWNNNDFLYLNNGKAEFKYSSVYFHYFVSLTTLKTYWDIVIDKFLKINNIAKNFSNTKNVTINIYNSSNWQEEKFLEAQQLVNSNLGEEYTINYISY